MKNIERIKTIVCIMITIIFWIVSTPLSAQVNGYKEDIEGIPVIHDWGTDSEMGYALGYLDGDKFATIMEDIIIASWGVEAWNAERDCFTTYFTVPSRVDVIVDAMIAGIADRPDSILFSPSLGRNYDDVDLHVCHSLTDITAVLFGKDEKACSSLSSWGDATQSDPELLGAPALARNLDSDYHPLLAEMHSVITLSPDSGNQVVSFGHPMDLDCSTAMNEYGLSLTRNAAYHSFISYYSPPFVPIGYSALLGMMEDDFDGSGTNDLEDLLAGLTHWNRAPSKNLHVAAPRSLGYLGDPAVVLEINNDSGYIYRTASADTVLGPEHMAATNHFRLLYPPDYCNRYNLLSDSISANPDMTLNRFWDFMGCCDIPGWHTYLTVLFLPESRKIGIAFCDSVEESWAKDPVWLTWDQLFSTTAVEFPEDKDESALNSIFPNPSTGTFTAKFSLAETSKVIFSIYSISGKLIKQLPLQEYSAGVHNVQISEISTGIYVCQMVSGNFTDSKRLVVVSK